MKEICFMPKFHTISDKSSNVFNFAILIAKNNPVKSKLPSSQLLTDKNGYVFFII